MTSQKDERGMTANSLPALKIGSRVRCTDDGMEGRITWANGVAVKIQWDDGEHVTWRRDSLADRPITILDPVEQQSTAAKQTTADAEPTIANNSSAEESTPLPHVVPTNADASEPLSAELVSPPQSNIAIPTPTVKIEAVEIPTPSTQRPQASAVPKQKKSSALEASVRVLTEAGQALNCQEMIAAMSAKGYWTSPGGKTPAATLYSALLREITTKGNNSRFVKAERGKFALAHAL